MSNQVGMRGPRDTSSLLDRLPLEKHRSFPAPPPNPHPKCHSVQRMPLFNTSERSSPLYPSCDGPGHHYLN